MAGQAVYGLVGGPGAAPQQQPAAVAGPYVFAPADTTNPYAMTWAAYSTKLRPHLDATYPVRAPAPARAAQVPAAAVAEPASDRGTAIRSLKAFIKANRPEGVRPPLAAGSNGWSNGSIDRLVDAAAQALPADPPGTPFNRAAFLASIRPLMADQDRQNTARGVGNNGIVVNQLFPFANIGP